MKKLKIAYVGFGFTVSRYHLPFVLVHKELYEVKQILLPEEKMLDEKEIEKLKKAGLPFSIDFKSLLGDRSLDLVIVTPMEGAVEVVRSLLLTRKNVFYENTAKENTSEILALIELAEKMGVFFLPYQNRLFDHDFLTVKSLLDKGQLGELLEIILTVEDDIVQSSAIQGQLLEQIIVLFGKPRNSSVSPLAPKNFFLKLIYAANKTPETELTPALVSSPQWTISGTQGRVIKEKFDQQDKDRTFGLRSGKDGTGIDQPQDFARLTFYNNRGEKVDKNFPTRSGDYAAVYEFISCKLSHSTEKSFSLE